MPECLDTAIPLVPSPSGVEPRAGLWARTRRRLVDDRGLADGIEHLFAGLFLMLLFLFFCEITIWWHARNILEQAAAEGARAAAAADGSCDDAPDRSAAMATTLGGKWVATVSVNCNGGTGEGDLVTVQVSSRTPAFFLPGSYAVSATASAPEEAP